MSLTFTRRAALAAAQLALAFASTQALGDAPPYAHLLYVSHWGSGCPAGSVGAHLTLDLQVIELELDNLYAVAGPGIPLVQRRFQCHLALDLEVPAGWSYTLTNMGLRGYVDLDRGVQGIVTSKYYFQGAQATGSFAIRLTGPRDDYVAQSDTLGFAAQIWSPCNASQTLIVTSDARLDTSRNARGSGQIGDPNGIEPTVVTYGIAWRRCR